MCRFMLAVAHAPLDSPTLLHAFADMADRSSAADGEFQGDGWGVAWRDGITWQVRKSLAPVWQDRAGFGSIPRVSCLMAHARAASFDVHKDDLAFNQPFVDSDGRWAFVFNGLLRGVRLPRRVPGTIGAQKIWNLLRDLLRTHEPSTALAELRDMLIAHSQRVQACNIGLSDGQRLFALTMFDERPAYYQLCMAQRDGARLIASAPLDGYIMQPLPVGDVVML